MTSPGDLTLAARSELPVLITARSGRVRSQYARAIHETSARGGDPLITIRCDVGPGRRIEAAAPLYAEIAAARHGSVFLDRIDALTPAGQEALFALMDCLNTRNGRDAHGAPGARLISGAGKSLARLVATGRFREDLFYRLNTIHLRDTTERDPHSRHGTFSLLA